MTSNAATLTVNPAQVATANLSLTYDPPPDAAFPEEELSYNLTIKNNGPDEGNVGDRHGRCPGIGDVRVRDAKPGHVRPKSAGLLRVR